MKWLSLILVIAIAAFSFMLIAFQLFNTVPKDKFQNLEAQVTAPTPLFLPDGQIIEMNFADQKLLIFVTEISSQAKVNLIPNFSGKENGQSLAEKNKCQKAINGGFYREDGKPLGLFISEGKEYGREIKSNLITGFFRQEKNKRYISRTKPTSSENLDFIIQTGPYMLVNTNKLKFVSDEKARRSLLGLDIDNKLHIISVVDKDNSYSGPFLSDIPVIFFQKEVKEQLPLVTLLNLDGGAASFFYTRSDKTKFSLSEITPIGSLICVN